MVVFTNLVSLKSALFWLGALSLAMLQLLKGFVEYYVHPFIKCVPSTQAWGHSWSADTGSPPLWG